MVQKVRCRQKLAGAFGAPWAPAEIFPEGGKVTDTLKSRHVFGAPYKKIDHFWERQNIGYLVRAPKARAKILGYFVGRQHMTSFFKFQGGKCPFVPLGGAHDVTVSI